MPLPNFIKVASEGKGLRRAKIHVCLWVTEGVAKAGTETRSYQKLIRLRRTFPPGVGLSQLNAFLRRSGLAQLILMISVGKRF